MPSRRNKSPREETASWLVSARRLLCSRVLILFCELVVGVVGVVVAAVFMCQPLSALLVAVIVVIFICGNDQSKQQCDTDRVRLSCVSLGKSCLPAGAAGRVTTTTTTPTTSLTIEQTCRPLCKMNEISPSSHSAGPFFCLYQYVLESVFFPSTPGDR